MIYQNRQLIRVVVVKLSQNNTSKLLFIFLYVLDKLSTPNLNMRYWSKIMTSKC
jgi:hypothetical protein